MTTIINEQPRITQRSIPLTPDVSTRLPIRSILLYSAGFAVMTVWSVLMLIIATLTLFQARRFYAEVMARQLARIGLWMGGVKLDIFYDEPLPDGQVIYVSNHGATLDVIVLAALGLPSTRCFLSGHLRRKVPLAVIGYLIGIFWTVPQSFPQRRTTIFQRAERILRRTGESVYLSPEGGQGTTGTIGPFNKGAFHLATNLGAPIIPFFIYLSPDVDPGWGYHYRPGVVRIHFTRPIPTKDWKLLDLDRNRAMVRDRLVELNEYYHGTQTRKMAES
jgi:1-acyl-sn-glycerol-3-phosphate acyltransferase